MGGVVADCFRFSLAIGNWRRVKTGGFCLAATSSHHISMNLIPISDADDPRLEPYRNLRSVDIAKRGRLFIAEGRLVVRRLLASRYPVASVLAEPNRVAELSPLVHPETPIYVATRAAIGTVAGFDFHRGVLACGERMEFSPIDRLSNRCESGRLALAAISLNDLENWGSLLRTAAAFGISDIVLNSQTADPLCRRVLRVSMGAALKMTYYDLAQPLDWFEQNRRTGTWRTIATTLAEDSRPLQEIDVGSAAKMIVLGNEADGLPMSIQMACTDRGKIPMAAGIDSLNVAVAGAIALYEFSRTSRRHA